MKISNLADSKFLITSGESGHHIPITKSEMIDLSELGNHICSNWADYPLAVFGSFGGLVGKNPIVCGGQPSLGFSPVDDCYR